jgi:hypothetical protein
MKVEGLFGKILTKLLLRKEDFGAGQAADNEETARQDAEFLFKVRESNGFYICISCRKKESIYNFSLYS